ncbi:hypothetical protein K445DRAFT_170707 [Daldinia sp. EC12]|nr:hypothetical protein K445DRAFT_170707 [Daldinia sp. EC12]
MLCLCYFPRYYPEYSRTPKDGKRARRFGSWPIPDRSSHWRFTLSIHSLSPVLPLILSLPFLTVLARRNLRTRSPPPLFTRIGFLSLNPFSITFISTVASRFLSRLYTFVTPRIATSTATSTVNKRNSVNYATIADIESHYHH